jgi:DNA modification methylase
MHLVARPPGTLRSANTPATNAPEIDLLYVDPPFGTGTTKTADAASYADQAADHRQHADWIAEHLHATLPHLKDSAALLVHIDWRTSHRVRCALDDALGDDRFVNHIVWSYGLGGSSPRRFARKHDDILFYCLHPERYWFDPPMVPATSNRMKGQLKKATDVLQIPAINNMAAERVGYPTQKPRALLETLINACCPPGGTVLDPCAGSGTSAIAAFASGRNAIAADASHTAISIMQARFDREYPGWDNAPGQPADNGAHPTVNA